MFSAVKLFGQLTAKIARAKIALPACIEGAEKWRSEAARLRCLEADVALLGAPDTFLDAIRRMIESFESFKQAYTASAIGCQAVADALQEKPFNPDRAAAALNISKGTMNLPELVRVRALEVRL